MRMTFLTTFGMVTALSLAGAAAACAPRAQSPAPTLAKQKPASPPRMRPVRATELGATLQAVGLDPKNLPAFHSLTPPQLDKVMETFTRSLGIECSDCHEANYAAPTRAKRIAARMWDQMVRPNPTLVGGGTVYCDSCHQGQEHYLDRTDRNALELYMSDSFTSQLKRVDQKEMECETCHGDPAEPKILAKW